MKKKLESKTKKQSKIVKLALIYSGVVAVLGPARMEYEVAIPAVRYTKSLLEELGANW